MCVINQLHVPLGTLLIGSFYFFYWRLHNAEIFDGNNFQKSQNLPDFQKSFEMLITFTYQSGMVSNFQRCSWPGSKESIVCIRTTRSGDTGTWQDKTFSIRIYIYFCHHQW